MTDVSFAPRPATEITPPLSYISPNRHFMSRDERKRRSEKGLPTLAPVQTYSHLPSRHDDRLVWDHETRRMVPRGERTWEKRAKERMLPDEYHLTLSERAPGTKIYTPCSKRPCDEADHVDVGTGKVVRWKGTNKRVDEVETVALPPFQESHILGYPPKDSPPSQPSAISAPPGTASASTATAPRLGSAIDIERPGAHLLRGTRRWMGTLVPSFRTPCDN